MTGKKAPTFYDFCKGEMISYLSHIFPEYIFVTGVRCIWCPFFPRPDQGISHLENLTKKTKCRNVPQVHLPAVTCPCQNHHSLLQGKKERMKDDQGSACLPIQFSIVVYAQLILLTDLCEQEVCLEISLYLLLET